MLNTKRMEQILGESFREIGILIFVFAPLDSLLAEGRLDVEGVKMAVLFAFGLIVSGTIVEGLE